MYKSFDLTKDVQYTNRYVYEYMPLSGNIFESGTYGSNAKTYVRLYPNQIYSGSDSGSFFITYYDRNISDSEAVELFDATFGISTSSSYYALSSVAVKDGKNRMYKQMAEACLGDINGRFNKDGTYYDEMFFITFKRNIFKDQVRKGYVNIYTYFAGEDGWSGSGDGYAINDVTARSSWYEGKGGTYQYLEGPSGTAGMVYYDLGVVALIPSGAWGFNPNYRQFSGTHDPAVMDDTYYASVTASIIDNIVTYAFEKFDVNTYPYPFTFYAEQVMQSAIYACRAGLKEFTYSSNPTFVDSEGRIIMTSGSKPTKASTFITTIALYSANNEVLGTAKISEPIKKSSDNEKSFTVRINY